MYKAYNFSLRKSLLVLSPVKENKEPGYGLHLILPKSLSATLLDSLKSDVLEGLL